MTLALRQHHKQILDADLALLKEQPQDITEAKLATMAEHLRAYAESLRCKDWVQSLALLPLLLVAGVSLLGGGFGGVALLIAAVLGKVPFWLGPLGLIAAACGFAVVRHADSWMQRILCAKWAASALYTQLRPATKYEELKILELAGQGHPRGLVTRVRQHPLSLRRFHYQAMRSAYYGRLLDNLEKGDAKLRARGDLASSIASILVLGACLGTVVTTLAIASYQRQLTVTAATPEHGTVRLP